jgi:pilus assembly protein CpaB
MRNRKAVLMIVFSGLMGLAAVFIAAKWLGARASMATSQVVVAARDIQLGTALTQDMIKTTEWPASALPDGAITDLKALEARVVRTAVQRGEAILEKKLAPVGTKGGLSSVISEGKRAVTVRVNEVVGVAGFALPGNLVDVMVNVRDQQDKSVSKIVLEQILVLAVAQEANRDETKPKVVSAVTLELSPGEAERLDLARSVGNLSLVLRNQLDKHVVQTNGVRTSDLLRLGAVEPQVTKAVVVAAPAPRKSAPRPAAAPIAAAESKPRLEVIKGTHKSTVEY